MRTPGRRTLKGRKTSIALGGIGFTLIELLVVIAVVSVLLAILLPALSYARCQAKRIACRGNLRQITQAWHMYLDDNEGRFYQCINANVTYGGWRSRNPSLQNARRPLNSYILSDMNDVPDSPREAEVFKCPSDNGGLIGQGMPCYDLFGTSYQTNVLLVGQDQKGWLPDATLLAEINKDLKDLNISRVNNPTQVLLIGDYGWANDWEPELPQVGDWHGRRHCHNLAYLDGHVAFLRIRKGLYITDSYTVLPFQALYGLARQVQKEEIFK